MRAQRLGSSAVGKALWMHDFGKVSCRTNSPERQPPVLEDLMQVQALNVDRKQVLPRSVI